MTIDQTRPTRQRSGALRPDAADAINASRIKRAMEIGLALVGLLLLLPLGLAIAMAIKIDSRGPVLYRQKRTGLNGQVFSIIKFRTMTEVASRSEFRQAERGDDRVTRMGRLLRSSNLDELPQLLNVLAGDMAIIGPRPHPLALDAAFVSSVPGYMARYAVRPGITGWAQVNGHRGETRTAEQMRARVEHDLHYIDNWSIRLDLLILLRTLTSARAYLNAF